ncbi:piRNA biogenesis protein EXD1 [Takifugu rubripes]|uniref:piRNA biogenesis protein EXD1 n=1 Tax=Takifugu rubripes TaxID=31033 RepID=UPI0005D29D7A|nr:piRNA biogenesis protein EXD1 [Takifugu rubripes]|eukprot:XP_011615048.1 PREDICTED: LOW QUALITY PROTEIN: exonuclease 3'-5' domain-containing protein 1 [Takifugu rubripes]
MHMEDDHFLNLFKGKRIKLSLRTASYIGVVQRINANKTLVLADVVYCSNGCKIPGTKVFFGHEVLNVELVDETSRESGPKVPPKMETAHTSMSNLNLDNIEEEEDCVHFVVIDEFQEKFGAAVMHIKSQCVIGVGADGLKMFEHGRLCWLQISTKKKVYLFDILILGSMAFRNGLSSILENKEILKVLHDCRDVAGCLIGQFGVKLTNVFDTQVADVMCFHSATGGFLPNRVSSLEQALSLHLRVPSSHLLLLQTKSQLTQDDAEVWQMRPSPFPVLRLMAVSVVHLHALRLVLLDNLMTDYMNLVDSYLNNSNYKPGELQQVDTEALALPPELRKLEQMLQERREQAMSRYPVNDQGLLARFSPRAQPPTQTSPAAQEPSHTRAHSVEPSSPPKQLDRVLQSVKEDSPSDICVSTDAEMLKPAAALDLREEMSVDVPLAPMGVGGGRSEVSTERPFRNVQSAFNPLPTIGRGALLHMLQAQNLCGKQPVG